MDYEKIQEMFPAGSQILEFELKSATAFIATLRLKCASKEEFQVWLADHQKLSRITYRVALTKPRTGKTVVYKALYRCRHNTKPTSHRVKTPSKRHTDCAAKLNVTIKSPVEGRVVRSQDILRADYPTIVTVTYDHNHDIDIPEFRDPNETVRLKFLDLFKSHTPAKAMEQHKKDLLEEQVVEEDYYKALADRSICPDMGWVYRLYYKTVRSEFGESVLQNFEAENHSSEILEAPNDNKSLGADWYDYFSPPTNSNKTSKIEYQNASEQLIPSADIQEEVVCEPARWEDCQAQMKEITEILSTHFEKNPETVSKAISAMHSRVKRIKSERNLVFAVRNFGKFKCRVIRMRKNAGSTTLLVRHTAKSNRKSDIGTLIS